MADPGDVGVSEIGTMPLSELITILRSRGCPDITQALALDLGESSAHPVAFGGFGDIYSSRLNDGRQVAVKCARISEDESLNRRSLKLAARELYTWSRCKHQNVVSLIGLAQFRGQLAMVSPWMDQGSLPQYLANNPAANRHVLCSQVATGLSYLHQVHMVHGDLRSGNVLVSEQGVAKLSDFGNTRLKEASLHFTTGTTGRALSIRWAVGSGATGWRDVAHTMEADVYALGMTILEVISGNLPFNGLTDLAVCNGVLLKKSTPVRPRDSFPINTQRSNQLWHLATRCWAKEAVARPVAAVVAEKLSRVVSNGAFILSQEPFFLHTPSNNNPSFRLSIPYSAMTEVEQDDTLLRKLVTIPILGHYQIVNCSLQTCANLPDSLLRLSVLAAGPDPTSSWMIKLQDDGNYQLKTKGSQIATSSAIRLDQVDETGTSPTNDANYCDGWDVIQTSAEHFRIQHPDLKLCWGVSGSTQEQVTLRNITEDHQNCWRFKPLAALRRVRPGLYRIVNIFYRHTLFGSTGDFPPTEIWRIFRGSYTIDRIQNKTHKFFISCAQPALPGTIITGSKDGATEWDIRTAPHSETSFLISPKASPHLYWGYPETGSGMSASSSA